VLRLGIEEELVIVILEVVEGVWEGVDVGEGVRVGVVW